MVATLSVVMSVWVGACGGAAAPSVTPASSTPTAARSAAPSAADAADAARDLAALPVKTVRVDDVRLAWRSIGSGPPLVLVMGLAGTLDVWSPPFLQALARHYTVIVFDNRGMGRSSDGRRPVSIEVMADDAAGLMRALGYGSYAVLGFSMGSLVAQEVALRHSSRVPALVLYATTPGGREATLSDWEMGGSGRSPGAAASPGTQATGSPGTAMLFDLARRLFPEEYRRANPDYLSLVPQPRSLYDLRGFPRQIGALAAWRGSWSRLPQLRLPVLLLTGSLDELTPPVNAERMAVRIPGSWLVRIRGAGHGVMYQMPRTAAQVVTTFLQVSGYGR